MDATEDVALDFGNEDDWGKQRTVRYPLAAVCHILFKVCGFVTYLLLYNFLNFTPTFVATVLLTSVDFWMVKNISGRLLVGLRWWNHIDEDGISHWVFEARKKNSRIQETATESRIFWLGIVIAPLLWLMLSFSSIFHFQWIVIPLIGFTLTSSNLYGYLRCKVGSKQQLSSFATQFLGQQLLDRATDEMTSKGTG